MTHPKSSIARKLIGCLLFSALAPLALAQSEEYILHSPEIGQDFIISLKLPEDQSPERKFPLVLFTDADQFYPTKDRSGQYRLMMEDISKELHIFGVLPELVLVGVGYPSPSYRSRDLAPTLDLSLDQKNSGGADKFAKFIETHVKPFVYSKVRIDRTNETYLGHSLGGLFGAYVLFNKPELFDHYVLSSPSFWYGFDSTPNRTRVAFAFEEQYSQKNTDLAKSVYLSAGSEEGGTMAWDVEEMYRTMARRNYKNLRLDWTILEGENHKTAVRSAYTEGLSFVFERN